MQMLTMLVISMIASHEVAVLFSQWKSYYLG
jgi:hypothetical protein